MNDPQVRVWQVDLRNAGLYDGQLDGYFGPATLAASRQAMAGSGKSRSELPWMAVAREAFGWHETRDNARLREWLASDGARLGNPAALPWCGDFVETAIKRGLPDEPFVGALGANPYWARNWATFGQRCEPTYGAVLVFERGATSGHVAFAVGSDARDFYVLGGNQGDVVGVTRIARARLIASRWPLTWPESDAPLPRMTPGGIPKSVNEF